MSDDERPQAKRPPWEVKASIIEGLEAAGLTGWDAWYDSLQLRYSASHGFVEVYGDAGRPLGSAGQVVRRVLRFVEVGETGGGLGAVEETEEAPKVVVEEPKPQAAPATKAGADNHLMRASNAVTLPGYESGPVCNACNGTTYIRTGTCLTCICGEPGGCG